MRQVTDNLYIGGLTAPKEADEKDIDRVISLHIEMEETTHAHPILEGGTV